MPRVDGASRLAPNDQPISEIRFWRGDHSFETLPIPPIDWVIFGSAAINPRRRFRGRDLDLQRLRAVHSGVAASGEC